MLKNIILYLLFIHIGRVGKTGIENISGVGEMGVGETGVGETEVGEMGVGETGTSPPIVQFFVQQRQTHKSHP